MTARLPVRRRGSGFPQASPTAARGLGEAATGESLHTGNHWEAGIGERWRDIHDRLTVSAENCHRHRADHLHPGPRLLVASGGLSLKLPQQR